MQSNADPADRAAIDAALANFNPPSSSPGQFSEWHFMLLRQEKS